MRRQQLGLTTTFRLTNILFTQNIPLSQAVCGGPWEQQSQPASLISRPAASITSHCSNHDEQDNHNHLVVFPLVLMLVTL